MPVLGIAFGAKLAMLPARQDYYGLRYVYQDYTATLGVHGVYVVRRGIQIVPRVKMIFPKANVTFANEDLLAAGMDVGGVACTGIELQEEGGRAGGGLVEAQDLDIDAGDAWLLKRLPFRRVGTNKLIQLRVWLDTDTSFHDGSFSFLWLGQVWGAKRPWRQPLETHPIDNGQNDVQLPQLDGLPCHVVSDTTRRRRAGQGVGDAGLGASRQHRTTPSLAQTLPGYLRSASISSTVRFARVTNSGFVSG